MDRHFACNCGGTAWVSREDRMTLIECAQCGTTISAETLSLAKSEWRQRQAANAKPPTLPKNPPSGPPNAAVEMESKLLHA